MRAIKILFCFVVYICINWMAYSKATFIIITIAVKKKKWRKVFLNVTGKMTAHTLVI